MKYSIILIKSFKLIQIVFYLYFSIFAAGQDNSNGPVEQFLYPQFSPAIVFMKDGQIQKADMNYNMLTGKMVYMKDDQFYDLINYEMVDTIFLMDNKFVPVEKVFLKVLISGPISFYLHHLAKLQSTGSPSGYGSTSQTTAITTLSSFELSGHNYNLKVPSNFIIKTSLVYWIRFKNEMFSFVNKRQLIKIFPDYEAELKLFINQHKIKFETPSDVINLIDYCNELISN